MDVGSPPFYNYREAHRHLAADRLPRVGAHYQAWLAATKAIPERKGMN